MELQLRRQNGTVLGTLEEGDLVEFPRSLFFSHWGVYVGDCEIVHLSGIDVCGTAADSSSSNVSTISGTGYKKARVRKDNFWNVAGESKVKKNNSKDRHKRPFSRREIKERALSKLGPITYSVLWTNCEHFAAWCRNGILKSEQADTGLVVAVVLGAIVVVGGIIGTLFSGSDDED